MATLFNTKISATYQGLLKTIDNAALSATLRELTDGSGNQSGLFLNTAGDFKVTAILEWGSLKDTGTGVTITQFVTQANGIANFDNDTTIPTSAAVKDYVDTKFSQTDTLTEVLGFGNTTSGKDILVSASDDITFTDSSKILMGAGSDLQIYHDGSNSFIEDTGTGSLRVSSNAFRIYNAAKSEFLATFNEGGSVDLYYNNTKRFETTTDGSKVTGNLVVTGTITGSGGSFLPLAGGTMTGNIDLGDNIKAQFGTSQDLKIYHDGSHSYIQDSGTGVLKILGSGVTVQNSAGSENMLVITPNGSVDLYYDNSKKFETTVGGASITGALDVTGVITADGGLNLNDNDKIKLGTSGDLQIYHDGSNSYIDETGTGDLRIKSSLFRVQSSSGEAMINASENGIVQLYENNTERFRTVSDGAKVTGNLEVTGTITGSGGSFLPLAGGNMTGSTTHNDSVYSYWGTGDDLQIGHDGSNSYIIDRGSGDLLLYYSDDFVVSKQGTSEVSIRANQDSSVELFFDNVQKLATTTSGISVTGNAALSAGFSIPDNQYGKFGTGDDIIIGHDSTNSIIRSSTGDLFIDQAAVTKSMIFRVSDANALDVTALTISRNGDLTTGRNVTIAGDLTVNGTTTTVNSQTLAVVDPLIQLAKDNTANSLDIGLYGDYNDGTDRFLGLFSDASDSNKFKLFKGTTVEPTTTVDIGGAGYVAADLELANLTGNGTILLQGSSTQTIRLIDDTQGVTLSSFAQDANAGFGTFSNHSLNLYSNSIISLTLDASQNASFSGDVSLADDKKIRLGTGNDLDIYHNGTTENSNIDNNTGNLFISNLSDNNDIFFRGKDGGSVITALTLDMSEGGAATFAGDVGLGGTGLYTNAHSLNIDGTGLAIKNDTNGGNNNWSTIKNTNTGSGSNIVFNTGQGVALTLNNDKSSTFDGAVGVGVTGGSNAKLEVLSNSGEVFRADSSGGAYRLVVDQTGVNVQGIFDVLGSISTSGSITTGSPLTIKAASPFIQWKNVADTRLAYIQHNATNLVMAADTGDIIVDSNTSRISLDAGTMQSWIAAKLQVNTESVAGSQTKTDIDLTTANWARFTNPVYSTDGSMGICLRTFPDSDNRQGAGIMGSGGSNNAASDLDLFVSKSTSGSTDSTTYSALNIQGESGFSTFIGGVKVNGDSSINRGNQSSGELLLGGTTDGGFLDFDSTNLQFNTQRDPNTGAFINTSKSHASIGIQGADGGSKIIFSTAAANNTVASLRMQITSAGKVGVGIDPTGYGKFVVSGTSSEPIISVRSSSGVGRLAFFEGGTGRFFIESLNGSDGINMVDGNASTSRLKINATGVMTINSENATAGQRTDNYVSQSIVSTYAGGDGQPYTGFGGGLAFSNETYNGTYYNSAGIFSAIGDDSTNTTRGGSLIFKVAPTKAGQLTERVRINENGVVKNSQVSTFSIQESTIYYGATGNATTNVSIDLETEFGVVGGKFLMLEVTITGYGNAGSNGLIFKWVGGGYSSHVPTSYHQTEVIANSTSSACSASIYYPSARVIGCTLVNTSGQTITGVMAVKVICNV